MESYVSLPPHELTDDLPADPADSVNPTPLILAPPLAMIEVSPAGHISGPPPLDTRPLPLEDTQAPKQQRSTYSHRSALGTPAPSTKGPSKQLRKKTQQNQATPEHPRLVAAESTRLGTIQRGQKKLNYTEQSDVEGTPK